MVAREFATMDYDKVLKHATSSPARIIAAHLDVMTSYRAKYSEKIASNAFAKHSSFNFRDILETNGQHEYRTVVSCPYCFGINLR